MAPETAALTRSVQFDWRRRVPRDPRKQAELLVDAAEALAAIVGAPRRFELTLALKGVDELPPRWSWTLVTDDAEPDEGGEPDEGEVRRRVAAVDREAMTALAREAFHGRGRSAILMHASVQGRWRRAHPVAITLWSLQGMSLEIDWPELDDAAAQADLVRAAELLARLGWAVAEDVDDELADLEDEGPRRGPVVLELAWRGDVGGPRERAAAACDAIAALAGLGPAQDSQLLLSFEDAAGRPRRTTHHYRGLGADELRAAVVEALAPQRARGLRGLVRGARAVTWLHLGIDLGDGVRLGFWSQEDLTLEVELRTPDFADPAAAGRDRVEQAVARLAHSGWKRAIRTD
ncbi:MAG TPA: hypothetical protein VMZ28_21610 [Kofleriaceae bacterium]|nr:hypothetical protein [Kofleriaceae bacterium]